jgi:hypothetical protein
MKIYIDDGFNQAKKTGEAIASPAFICPRRDIVLDLNILLFLFPWQGPYLGL